MSELRRDIRPPSFFDLYSRGQVSPDDVDDFVGRWHDDQEPWSRDLALHEYLGVTHEEYQVWLCDPFVLPDILQARRSHEKLVDVVTARYEAMRAANQPDKVSILFSLRNWLKQHPRP